MVQHLRQGCHPGWDLEWKLRKQMVDQIMFYIKTRNEERKQGAAFTTIINSLIADMVMPPIGLLIDTQISNSNDGLPERNQPVTWN